MLTSNSDKVNNTATVQCSKVPITSNTSFQVEDGRLDGT